MEPLPPQMLPAVRHVTFGIFNLAVPNVMAWLTLTGAFFAAAWARLPRIFEADS
jgi:hypothetical protein